MNVRMSTAVDLYEWNLMVHHVLMEVNKISDSFVLFSTSINYTSNPRRYIHVIVYL